MSARPHSRRAIRQRRRRRARRWIRLWHAVALEVARSFRAESK